MSVEEPVLDRVNEIITTSSVVGTRLIAIDGPAGSGKTTLAKAVASRFDAPVVEIDDFFCGNSLHSWWPRFETQVVAPLLRGEDALYQVRDWRGDEFGDGLRGEKRTRWAPVIVIEGVTSSHRALAASLACRIWVEAPPAQRLARGIARDGESHRELWRRYMAEEAVFFAEDRTRERADLILDTSDRRL